MPDMSKLPKWAQDRINDAEYKVKEYENLERSLSVSPESASITFADGPGASRPLPERATVRFNLPGKAYIYIHLDSDGYLRIYSSHGTMNILPRAGNSIYLTVSDV